MERTAKEAKAEMAREQQERREERRDQGPAFRPPKPRGLSDIFPKLRDPELVRRVRDVEDLLAGKGLEPISYDGREEMSLVFQDVCRARWKQLAAQDDTLKAAREALFEADSERFAEEGRDGYHERRAALSGPLGTLMAAGEAAVPHLGVCLMTDSWASVIAIESLALMPPGPLRNRAIVEGLFVVDDWVPDASIEAARPWSPDEAWDAFEGVVRRASEDAVELPSAYWAELFIRNTDGSEGAVQYGPAFGRALRILYECGHHAAVARAFDNYLDPMWDGEKGVRSFLEDEAVQSFLSHVRDTPAITCQCERASQPDIAPFFSQMEALSNPVSEQRLHSPIPP